MVRSVIFSRFCQRLLYNYFAHAHTQRHTARIDYASSNRSTIAAPHIQIPRPRGRINLHQTHCPRKSDRNARYGSPCLQAPNARSDSLQLRAQSPLAPLALRAVPLYYSLDTQKRTRQRQRRNNRGAAMANRRTPRSRTHANSQHDARPLPTMPSSPSELFSWPQPCATSRQYALTRRSSS